MSAPLTYVYCLVQRARRPALRGVPPGIAGSRELRALDAGGGLWIIASSVPEQEMGEAAVQRGLQNLDWVGRRAMEHERIVEAFLEAPAVLPMQLFTLFKTDERALAHVARDRARIDAILKRIAGHVEWGLRLTWDEQGVRRQVEQAHARPRSGSDYLARKKDLLDVNRVRLADARHEAERVYTAMARAAAGARRRTATEQAATGSRLLLDAAFLVPVRGAAKFKTALRQQTKALAAAGLGVSLTGPWPPYNFI